jgi:hypothetical protein
MATKARKGNRIADKVATPTRKRTSPGYSYDTDLEVIDALFFRNEKLRKKAREFYLEPRLGSLKGKPNDRRHWHEYDQNAAIGGLVGEKIHRMVKRRLAHLLDKARPQRQVSISVAAAMIGVSEITLRRLWKEHFKHGRETVSILQKKTGRHDRATMRLSEVRLLDRHNKAKVSARTLGRTLPKATKSATKPRPFSAAGTNQAPTFKLEGASIVLDLGKDPERIETILSKMFPILMDANGQRLGHVFLTGISDAEMRKLLTSGSTIEYMTMAEALKKPWANVEEQARWTTLYRALLGARIEAAQAERSRAEAALLTAVLPPEPTTRRHPVRL